MNELSIERSGMKDSGACECCGGYSRTVWGYVYRGNIAEAAYFVQWTLGDVDRHGANFDLIVGKWGEGTNRSDRTLVSLAFRRTDSGPACMVIDSAGRPSASSDLVGKALARNEVVDTQIAKTAFEIVDALMAQDERISELVGAA